MDRNANNRFSNVPNIDIPRAQFRIPFNHKTTINAGDLVPVAWWEILPGDTVKMTQAQIVRMATPIYPVADNAYIDSYFFFVPNRLIWKHWRDFMGENTTTHWIPPVEYEIPMIKAPETGWAKGSTMDYLGAATKVPNVMASHLPLRAYCLIWNEWFRDENLKDPAMINLDETTLNGKNKADTITEETPEYDYVENAQLGAAPLKAARFHSLFTSALPSPQKGPDVLLPIGNIQGLIPVITGDSIPADARNDAPLRMYKTASSSYPTNNTPMIMKKDTGEVVSVTGGVSDMTNNTYMPANLWAATNYDAANIQTTINMFRQALAIQTLLERDARSGTRYREIIKGHFNITTSDARMQVPEYLGGERHLINMDSVLQMSATNDVTPQGNAAGYSLTNFTDENVFTKSFEEHGILMCVQCIRTDETYQQGMERYWFKKNRYDFYWPALANIGEQPVYNREIYTQGTREDEEVFGYQERWYEYRYKPSIVTGAFRSNYEQSLDAWHYANDFDELPTLSSEFIDAPTANVDRTIAVTSELENQFLMDMRFEGEFTRPMPLYSIPGLSGHA